MMIKNSLLTVRGTMITATILTLLVLAESIFPPWAPYFLLYAALAIVIPVFLKTFRFGSVVTVLKKHWKITGAAFLATLLWDMGICTLLAGKLLSIAGMEADPYYSITAALTALADKAAWKFGISPDLSIFLYALFVLLWAPIGEELFYRGYMQDSLKKHSGFVTALLVQALFFGIRHATHFFFLWPQVPVIAALSWAGSAFVYGLLMGCLYEKTSSLWPPVIVHALTNIAGIIFTA